VSKTAKHASESGAEHPQPRSGAGKAKRWARRAGAAGFMFFLIKGLAWLIVPAAIVAWEACSAQ